MPVRTFSISTENEVQAQPNALGEQLILRSTDPLDTLQVNIVGVAAGLPHSESITLTGDQETATAAAFELISMVNVASAPAGQIHLLSTGLPAMGDIRLDDQPEDEEVLLLGLEVAAIPYTFVATLTGAPQEILIGTDKYQTTLHLALALNGGTGEGTLYGTDTLPHPHLSAWADSLHTEEDLDGTTQTTIYLRDRLPVARQIPWRAETSSSSISLRAPWGGTTGDLLALLSADRPQLSQSVNFANASLSAFNLPAAATPITDPIYQAGRAGTLHLYAGPMDDPVQVSLQTSEDELLWYDSGTTIAPLDGNRQLIPIAHLEHVRLAFHTNANATAVSVHASVITE